MSDQLKRCPTCGEDKPLTEFHSYRGTPGAYFWCKTCSAVRRRARYEANKAKVSAAGRARYEANREARLAQKRAYYEANADKWPEYTLRRRAQQHATTVGPIDLDALWTGDCALCGKEMDPDLVNPDRMRKSIDHIVPLSKGGTHTQDNLQWAHLRCNQSKGARLDFLPLVG